MQKIILSICLLLFPIFSFANTPTYTETQTNITLTSDQPTFIIRLKANPTTGYNWSVNYNKSLLKLLGYTYVSSYNPAKKVQMVGAPGYGVWIFELVPQPSGALAFVGKTNIEFSYQRQWEKQPINQLVYTVSLPTLKQDSMTNDVR